jgi:branched-chain amino acid transport system permease protein
MLEIPQELLVLILQITLNFSIGVIVTLSLNLEVGYLGIPQFGRVLTVLIGAVIVGGVIGRIVALYLGYPAGLEYVGYENFKIVSAINSVLAANPFLSISILILTLVLAGLVGGVVGYLTAYPALRLKEAYLGITLLAFGDIAQIICWNYEPIAGGTVGVNIIDPFRFTGEYRIYIAIGFILFMALLIYIYIERLTNSPFGRALRASRDSETASRVYGKDIVRLRAQTLIIGGAISAIGGALWALYSLSFKAITYTRLLWTFYPWAYMMLGGTGNNLGIVLGVFLFSTLRTLIIMYKDYIPITQYIQPARLEYILVGLTIVLVVLLRPQGILPEKPVRTLPKKRIERLIKRS